MRRFFFASVVVILATLPLASRADQNIGLGATVTRFDLDVVSGATSTSELSVFNQTSGLALPVHVVPTLWSITDEGDREVMTFGSVSDEALDASKWFTVTPADFILDPNGARKVSFTIAPPDDAPAGSYLVMLRFIPAVPEQYFQEQGPRFIPELGVLVFLNVHPLVLDTTTPPYAATIQSFGAPANTNSGLLSFALPQAANAGVFDAAIRQLSAHVLNTGLYHFTSSGSVVIRNILGQTVETIPIPERYLLPGKTRAVDVSLVPPTEPQASSWWQRLGNWLHDQSYLGPYTATMILRVPGNGPTDPPTLLSASTGFWVIPWQLMGIVLLTIGVLFLIFRRGHRFVAAARVLFSRQP